MNRNFERGGSRKTGTRRLRKFWKVCAWGLSISMILGMGNIGSYIVTADDGEVQVTEIPAETSEPETETSEEPVFSVSPESTPSPEAAAYAVTEMTPAPSESTQPSESPAWTAAPEPSAISTLIPETAAPEPSAESMVLPETAEPVSSPVATEAPASMPEMSFEQKEETTGITVSVKAEAGTFPKGTTMELSPVEDQSILEDAKQASELQNPSAVAVDITFRDPDGNIIEPQKQIRVTMTSDVIRQAESVDVVHVPDQAEDTSTAVVDQVPDQNLSEEEKPAEDQVVFDADQFSVYAIVYTVDFTFSGYTYSMEGGSSILLSSLASQLGLHDSEHDKDFDITAVAGVSFSDPSLVSIEQRDNDYMLTSLQPFTSAETLTIAMNDGSKYLVDVKDEQSAGNLGNYIESVVTYTKDGNGRWFPNSHIKDGDEVKFELNFSVGTGLLTKGQVLSMQMDSTHINVKEQITGDALDSNGNVVGTMSVSPGGNIILNLNSGYDVSKAFDGSLTFYGTAHNSGSGGGETVHFGSTASVTIYPNNTSGNNDISVKKKGEKCLDDSGKQYIRYDVTISTTKGTGDPIQFLDVLSASGIAVPKYDADKINVYKNDEPVNRQDYTLHINSEGNTFEIDNLPGLEKGKTYHVIYEVPVAGNITSADGGASITNNCSAWNGLVYGSDTTTTIIHEPVISKTGMYDRQRRIIKWTITVNNPDGKDLGGTKLTDVLNVDGNSFSTNSPIIFSMKDSDSNDLTTSGSFNINGIYTFPSGSCAKKYTITYETSTETLASTGTEGTQSRVSNRVTFVENGHTYQGTSGDIIVDHGNYNVGKWFAGEGSTTDKGEQQFNWSARIDLPEGQLDLTKLFYTDTLTASHGNEELVGKHYITPALLSKNLVLRADAIAQQDGTYLEAGKDYRILDLNGNVIKNSSDETELYGFKIEFLDKAKLCGKQSISLWYVTLSDNSEQAAGSTWKIKNKATIPGHEAQAEHDYQKPAGELTKQISTSDNVNSYSSDTPEIEYSGEGITLYYRVLIRLDNNSKGEQTIIDTLPAGVVFNKLTKVVYYENESYQPVTIWDGSSIELIKLVNDSQEENQADGTTKVTFTLSSGYERTQAVSYQIAFYYTATIKDTQYWRNILHDKKNYTNSVEWKNLKSEVTANVKHTIRKLDKVGKLSDVEGASGIKKAGYYLTVNPKGEDLAKGSDMLTLTDQMDPEQKIEKDVGIVFQPSSLKVYAFDSSKDNNCGALIDQNRYQFSYDEQSRTFTLHLPDQVPCVVYYEYYLTPGTNDANVINSAKLSGVADSNTSNQINLAQKGAGAIVSRKELDLFKVDSENYNIRLKDVKFDLYEYEGYINDQAKWIIVKKGLTTDSDGKIYLNQSGDGLKLGTLYKFVETELPNNSPYKLNDTPYYFVWAKRGDELKNDGDILSSVNQWSNSGAAQNSISIIRNSGIIYVPNEKTGITIKKIWQNADHTDDSNPGTAHVTLFRQARKPGGVKVTVFVKAATWDQTFYEKEIYIKAGTEVSLLFQPGSNQECSVNDGEKINYWDTQEHTLLLGKPDKETTYTVKVSYQPNKIEGLLYAPTDQYTDAGEKEPVPDGECSLNRNNGNSCTISPLPLEDANKNKYYYWVEEDAVNGYTTSYSDNNGKIQKGTITVTNTRESVTVSGSKAWKNVDGSSDPPAGASCVFELYKDGTATGNRIKLDGIVDDRETSAWKAVFPNLEKYNTDGKEIHYTVREIQSPDGYASDKKEIENGGTITNSQKDKTFVLPDTGSYGTNLITRSGVVLLLFGGAFLIMRKLLILKSGGERGGSI